MTPEHLSHIESSLAEAIPRIRESTYDERRELRGMLGELVGETEGLRAEVQRKHDLLVWCDRRVEGLIGELTEGVIERVEETRKALREAMG